LSKIEFKINCVEDVLLHQELIVIAPPYILLVKEASFKIPELSNDILACQCGHLSEAKIKSQD
jgi:hypothetical protein